MWHLPQFSKRLELLIKPSGFGYNAYNQTVVVKIPNQVIPYLTDYYYMSFVDIEGNSLYFSSKRFSPGTNEVEYYVKIESIDDVNYTSLFFYYDIGGSELLFYGNCTWNPSDKSSRLTLSNGNLTITHTGNHTWGGVRATISISSGKLYWEVAVVVDPASACIYIGIGNSSAGLESTFGGDVNGYAYRDYDGRKNHNDSLELYGNSYTAGDIIGIALDLDNGKIWWSKNNVWQASGNPSAGTNEAYSGISGIFFPMQSTVCGGTVTTARFNATDQTYSPPSGFSAGFYKSDNDSMVGVFEGAYIVNFLDTTSLNSEIGPNFSNHSASLHQPICDTYATKITGGTTYISCNISKSNFTLFFNCYLLSGIGYLVYFSSSNYVYVNSDGSLIAKINGVEYTVGAKLYFNTCSTFSITCDGNNVYIVVNGLTKLVIKQTFSISEIRLGGNGSSGYSVECYFFDLFLLPSKLPLYSYYLHNTMYDNSNFFREAGYDNNITNGYLTYWPEVIFAEDEVIFRSNSELVPEGWEYYRPITITNSGTSFLSDYQIKVELSVEDLGNPYRNIRADGSDIRFISISGSALLPYWIESWNNTGDSYVWVNVSGTGSIPVGESTIRMYYGNLTVFSDSNGNNVFEFFDSFETYSGYSECERCYSSSMCGSSYYSDILNNIPVLRAYGDKDANISRYAYRGFSCVPSGKLEITVKELLGPNTPYTNQDTGIYYYLYDHEPDVDVDFGSQYSTNHFYNTTNYMTGSTGNYFVNNSKKSYWVNNPIVSFVYVVLRFYDVSNIRQYNAYVDYIYVRQLADMEPVLVVGEEVTLNDILIDIPLNLYVPDELLYSVSFDNGNNWCVSNLNYDEMFTKYFGSQHEYDTILRLSTDIETIDKNYIVKINDFNQFSINYDVDFLVGDKKDTYSDVITDFKTALHDKEGISVTPVEYAYDGGMVDLKSFYLEKPVNFSWGGVLGGGIISKTVEFCFDIVMDSWLDDIYVDFWLGELYPGYYINMPVYFTVSSGWNFYIDVGVDFTLANWKYFPYQLDMICSDLKVLDRKTEVEVGNGRLMRFLSDIKASDMVYGDFTSSVFCSLSGVSPNYFFDVQTISGTLKSYDSNIYCSLLDVGDCYTEIKLNTIVIENFSMRVDDINIGNPNFCFSVDVYDRHYGVTESGINIYMNTDVIIGNKISSLSFIPIQGGSNVSWCYDVSLLSPLEYVEVIVYVVNTCGDLNIASYFLRYGKRYYYNLYHIVKHDYETLIPMLMVAENNVNIFPSFSAESMYVRIENYKRKNLSASIFGVGLDRSELPANINAITTNFYSGGTYKVKVECKDLSGNVMDPFEFEFIIRSDGL